MFGGGGGGGGGGSDKRRQLNSQVASIHLPSLGGVSARTESAASLSLSLFLSARFSGLHAAALMVMHRQCS